MVTLCLLRALFGIWFFGFGALTACVPVEKKAGIIEIQPQQSFVLLQGQTANWVDQQLKLKFENVLEDSRCPKDAQCVWAGQVRLSVSVYTSKVNLENQVLTLPEVKPLAIDGHHLHLDAVDNQDGVYHATFTFTD